MKNLLLSGIPGCGKSTAILHGLGSRLDKAAGFRTLRVFSTTGKHRGFCEIEADGIRAVDVVSDITLPGQFMVFDEERSRRMEVFRDFTFSNIKKSLDDCACGSRDFIVLDEIGGIELADEELGSLIIEALESRFPCIGIIKIQEHAEHLFSRWDNSESMYARYTDLFDHISHYPETQLYMCYKDHREAAAEAVCRWALDNGIT